MVITLSQSDIDSICKRLYETEKHNSKRKCPDCGVKPNTQHVEGCDVARCTKCGGQRLGCGCRGGKPDEWTGLWPGYQEAYENKLIRFEPILGDFMFDLNAVAMLESKRIRKK